MFLAYIKLFSIIVLWYIIQEYILGSVFPGLKSEELNNCQLVYNLYSTTTVKKSKSVTLELQIPGCFTGYGKFDCLKENESGLRNWT